MTKSEIETHVQRFSKVVDRVLDYRGSLQSNGDMETNLAAVAIVQEELLQLRAELAQPTREYLGHKIIEHDYQALIRLVDPSQVSDQLSQTIEVNEYGRVTKIIQDGGDYSDLADIELLTELRHLTLDFVQVPDCSSLSKLPHLKSFTTAANNALNIETIGAMPALEHFMGDQSCIADLSWVSRCPNIKALSLQSCNIDSIEGLGSCQSLQLLDISENPIKSLAPIAGHLVIQRLFIQGTEISDPSPLVTMPSLGELTVSSKMTELQSFDQCLSDLTRRGVVVIKVD